jgi:CHAT domain-containing protein
MKTMSLALLLLALAAQENEPPVALQPIEVGETVHGELTSKDAGVSIMSVQGELQRYSGESFRLSVTEPGLYVVELEAFEFVPWLMMWEIDGELRQQALEYTVGLNPYIGLEATGPTEYRLDVCTSQQRTGPFVLRVGRELPSRPPIAARRAADRDSAALRLELVEGRYGSESAEYAHDLGKTASMYFRSGDYGEALARHERALAIGTRVLGADHPECQRHLDNVASTQQQLGRLTEAGRAYEQLLALRLRLYGSDAPTTAQAHLQVAELLRAQGLYEQSAQQAELALPTLEKLNESAVNAGGTLGRAHTVLADAFGQMGDYERAEEHARRALRASQQTWGEDGYGTLSAMSSLGQILSNRGKYQEARPLLEAAYASHVRFRGEDDDRSASALGILASLQHRMGDLESGLDSTDRALAVLERKFGPSHPKLVPVLFTRGKVLRGLRDYDGALESHERCLALCERHYGKLGYRTLYWRIPLAAIHMHRGELELAEASLLETIEGLERNLAPDHQPVVRARHLLAYVAMKRGDPKRAVGLFEDLLPITERQDGRGGQRTADVVSGYADSLVALGRADEAWSLRRGYWPEHAAMVGNALGSLTEGERVAYLARISDFLDRMVPLAAAIDRPAVHEEAYAAVLGWKGWGTRLLYASRETLAAGVDASTLALVRRLQEAQTALTSLAYDHEAAARNGYEQRLTASRRRRNTAELELQRALGPASGEATTPTELRESLPPGSAVIDFLVRDRVHAWVTRSDRDRVTHVDLGSAEALEAAVREHLREVRDASETGAGTRLRALLWAPLAAEVGDARLVFVSPDGMLGGLPFETIPLDDNTYLVEERAFAYLQDASSLPRVQSDEPWDRTDSLLVCGGLDFDERGALGAEASAPAVADGTLRGSFPEEWEALPGTAREAAQIAQQFDARNSGEARALVLLGSDATEERVRHELPRHTVLHLATHGFFQPDGLPSLWTGAVAEVRRGRATAGREMPDLAGLHPGLLTGLVLSGANAPLEEGRDDGYLTAEELQWLDLSNVELIVLSACETGVGRPRAGEGMIGLRRACRVAGARTVVSSLWKVEDSSTRRLMKAFYANLWGRGMGRLEALRAAQLLLLEEHLKPNVWGAFTLSGDWR